MHQHEHAADGVEIEPGTPAWSEWVRDYYRDEETYDWVDVADTTRAGGVLPPQPALVSCASGRALHARCANARRRLRHRSQPGVDLPAGGVRASTSIRGTST